MKALPNDVFFAWVEAELAGGRPVRIRMKGVSMHPLLRNGKDEVVLYPFVPEALQPMDVVLFRYRGKHLLHRILQRKGERLLIQGDGSYVAKEECTVADVLGIVKEIHRPSGKVLSVNSFRWRWLSRLWVGLGLFRPFFLRVYNFQYKNISS